MLRSLWEGFRGLFTKDRSAPAVQSQPDSMQGVAGRVRIVALISSPQDRELLSRLSNEQHWILHFAASCGEAWEVLNESKAPIVLCDRDLATTEWRDVIQIMVSSPHKPCAILVSRVADDYLWNEVIRRGGHDLLATPLREEDVLRAVRLAWSYWSSSLKVQPILMKHYL